MIYISIVSFVIGIVFEQVFGMGWSVGVFVFFISVIIYFILPRDRKYWGKIFLLVGISLAVGIFRMALINNFPDAELAKKVGEKVELVGEIVEEPDGRDANVRYVVTLENSKSKILLIANRFPEYKYGDRVKVSGKLDLPKNFEGDNGLEFDYISYLSKDDIHFLIWEPSLELLENKNGVVTKIFSALYSLKHYFIAGIERVVPEPNASLLSGMIFGAKQSLGADLLDQFKIVGLVHIIVLSGQNITIIAAGVFLLASYYLERNKAFLLSSITIFLFVLMVGLSAPAVRGAIMAVIAILAKYLGRPHAALRWLFISGLVMLLVNPTLLLNDPSFQLSFAATFGLIVFTPLVARRILFITPKFELREIVASTIAVQIFILPLLIRMSGQVSIVSFLVNPLVLPFTPIIMGLGGLAGGLGLFLPPAGWLAWVPGIVAYFFTGLIIKIVEISAELPFAAVSIGALSIFSIFVWYGIYAFLYFKLTPPGLRPPSP